MSRPNSPGLPYSTAIEVSCSVLTPYSVRGDVSMASAAL
jgi:hypothetical protein